MSDFRLRVFSSVAKNLSFTKASQELFISHLANFFYFLICCLSPIYIFRFRLMLKQC